MKTILVWHACHTRTVFKLWVIFTVIILWDIFIIFTLLYLFSAGLTVQNKANNPVSTPEEAEALFDSLHKDILSKSFSNILSMASKERIDKLKYPQKMQNMQKLAVQDVAKSDKSRKKVSLYYWLIFIKLCSGNSFWEDLNFDLWKKY